MPRGDFIVSAPMIVPTRSEGTISALNIPTPYFLPLQPRILEPPHHKSPLKAHKHWPCPRLARTANSAEASHQNGGLY